MKLPKLQNLLLSSILATSIAGDQINNPQEFSQDLNDKQLDQLLFGETETTTNREIPGFIEVGKQDQSLLDAENENGLIADELNEVQNTQSDSVKNLNSNSKELINDLEHAGKIEDEFCNEICKILFNRMFFTYQSTTNYENLNLPPVCRNTWQITDSKNYRIKRIWAPGNRTIQYGFMHILDKIVLTNQDQACQDFRLEGEHCFVKLKMPEVLKEGEEDRVDECNFRVVREADEEKFVETTVQSVIASETEATNATEIISSSSEESKIEKSKSLSFLDQINGFWRRQTDTAKKFIYFVILLILIIIAVNIYVFVKTKKANKEAQIDQEVGSSEENDTVVDRAAGVAKEISSLHFVIL